MKLKFIIYIVLQIIITGCDDFQWDLERDNPLDNNTNLDEEDKDANIEYNSIFVYSDDNNDQIINPGESISLKVTLLNSGTSKASGVSATITTSSSYITNLNNN